MRLRTKVMLCAAGVYSYLLIKETLNLDRRFTELNNYEVEVDRKITMFSKGIDVATVVDVDYDEVL